MRNFVICTLHQILLSNQGGWLEDEACIGEIKNAYIVLVRNLKGRAHL
jgi:hypothetical protein